MHAGQSFTSGLESGPATTDVLQSLAKRIE